MNRKEQYNHHRDLAARAQKGDKFAANELVRQFEPFVLSIVRHRVTGHSLDKDDLIQIARMGLMHAVKKWDPNRNVAFISYAGQWIRSYVQRHIERDSSPITISYGVLNRTLRADRNEELTRSNDPLMIEAAVALKSKFLSLHKKTNYNEGLRYEEIIYNSDNLSQEELADLNSREEKVKSAINNLSLNEKESAILRCRIMQDPPMPLAQVAKRYKFKCSSPYLFQVEQKLILKLSEAIGKEFPTETERSELVKRTKIAVDKRNIRNRVYGYKKRTKVKEKEYASAS